MEGRGGSRVRSDFLSAIAGRVRSDFLSANASRVGSGQRFAGSGSIKVTRGQLCAK